MLFPRGARSLSRLCREHRGPHRENWGRGARLTRRAREEPPPGELAQRSFDRSATKSEAVQPGCIGRRFRSGARAPCRPRSGRCGGRSYPTSAASGSGFRSGARAPCRPRSGRCGGRSYPTSAASGSGFRSGARAPCRPRSGRCGGRSYPTSAASGSGFRSGARAPRRPRSGRAEGGDTRPPSLLARECHEIAGKGS